MTETATTSAGVPLITADPFSPANLTEPHALHKQLREAGPVVYLDRYGIWGIARYEQWSVPSACSASRRSSRPRWARKRTGDGAKLRCWSSAPRAS
jgi:hypothetical protein